MYDVIVVGAGPAGSSAARRCAQLGMNTLLVDKAIFPRDKLCAGGLSEQGMAYLDFELPREMIERDIYGARVHCGNTYVEVTKPNRIGVTVSRCNFDYFLFKKAQEMGVETLEGSRVSAIQLDDDHVKVMVSKDVYLGSIVIGADGFDSVAAKYVRRKHARNEYAVCLESKVFAENSSIDAYIYNAVDIYFNIAYGGYGWVFPHNGYFSIGVGGLASQFSNPKEVMHNFLFSVGFPSDIHVKGYPVPVGGIHRNILADRLLLAGDAAGFVDAFCGEGLAFAIRSGQLAAEVANTALRNGNCSAQGLNDYIRNCEQEFERDLRYSRYLSQLMHRFPEVFLKMIASEADVLDRYLEVPARQRSYQNYLEWLLPRLPFLLVKSMIK